MKRQKTTETLLDSSNEADDFGGSYSPLAKILLEKWAWGQMSALVSAKKTALVNMFDLIVLSSFIKLIAV